MVSSRVYNASLNAGGARAGEGKATDCGITARSGDKRGPVSTNRRPLCLRLPWARAPGVTEGDLDRVRARMIALFKSSELATNRVDDFRGCPDRLHSASCVHVVLKATKKSPGWATYCLAVHV